MTVRAETLRCKRHACNGSHAGHLTVLPPLDPRRAWEIRQIKRQVGRETQSIIARIEKYRPLSEEHRRAIRLFVSDSLFMRDTEVMLND